MVDIDTRAVEFGRYFTASEAEHRANVCLIGDTLVKRLFLDVDPIGQNIRIGNDEFMVIGIMEKIGSVLGQDQDNFVTVPLSVFLRIQGIHSSLTINAKASAGKFEAAKDQAQPLQVAAAEEAGDVGQEIWLFRLPHRLGPGAVLAPRPQRDGGPVALAVAAVGDDEAALRQQRDAGECNAAAARDWRATRCGRDPARHPRAIHRGKRYAMRSGRNCGHRVGIPGRASAAHLLSFPGVSADLGCRDGGSNEFRGGIIFRNLPGAARVAAGSGCCVEVGLMTFMTLAQASENFFAAMQTLRSSKVRSALTVLGIVIGVSSVISMAAIIQGLNKFVQDRVESLGSRTYFLTRFPPGTDPSRMPQRIRIRRYFEYDYAEFIRAAAPDAVLRCENCLRILVRTAESGV